MPDLPWDVVVLGVPASVQGSASRRKRWKTEVATAAQAAWPANEPPLTRRVLASITYFHVDAPLDTDNMLKPIQDALIGIVYDDDNRITDIRAGVRDVKSPFRVFGLSQALADGFTSGGPFVHIKIENPPDEQELP
ncbi:RusA family crossover junction endodeoxyribonuclease [Streptomyces noursei]|uniref:RusA family crossover junction endodeoxyribonuclease n=1 Tax=Streptomyces noursei TaxID=1971 RepID=UPI003818D3FA